MNDSTKYADDSLALHTDRYQLNMGEVYWASGVHDRKAVFDVYFRKLPFDNGYAVFAGLERIVRYLEQFRFTDSDLAYLREEGFSEPYLDYLRRLRFTGTVRSVREGEIVFANEPILRIEAPIIQCQLIETAVLNIVNYQTLIATKASRIKHVVGDDLTMEFGTRRAQEMDAAVWGARAAVIGGFDGTSNVRAGKLFGIPVVGTHAHAMVQAYEDEYTAFRQYASRLRHCIFLVDTYDTLKSGVPNAIKVAKEFGGRIRFVGIRIDSGDLAYLSKQARRMLDEAGFRDAKIFASSDLDENTIMNLKAQGAKIDAWGVGTKLITAYDQPALGAVFKLAAMEDEQGRLVDKIKISSNPEKMTTPGLKKIYRIINRRTRKSEGDYIALEHERPDLEQRLTMFHPVHTHLKKVVTDFDAQELHHTIFENGKRVYELPDVAEIKRYVKDRLELLWDEYKRTLNPSEYPVDLSQACWDNKMRMIREVREWVERGSDDAPSPT